MISVRRTLFFIPVFVGIAGIHVPAAMAQAAKVDVCHIPPGNPENAHTITISENALQTHLDHGDHIGPCEPTQTGDRPEPKPEAEPEPKPEPKPGPKPEPKPEPETEPESPPPSLSACTCPRAGVWRVTNHEGWMECQPFGIRRTDAREDKNDGAIWILNDDCSTIFSEAYEKQREDVIMDRGRDCLFFGTAPGEEDGAQVIFDGAYKVETEEFITGEYHMEMASSGIQCTGFSPFQIDFLRPLNEKDYAKLEKTMQKELEKARKVLDEHQEQIDAYLEKTNGGKAFGGRNGQN